MTAWPKYLAQVTIPAGTYASILHVGAALQLVLRALGGGHATDTVTISQVGKTTLSISGLATVTWGSTNDALEALFGFTTDETVADSKIVSENMHSHGWYPGVTTLGTASGIGISSDSLWEPGDDYVRTVTGAGNQVIVGPSRPRYTRTITHRTVHKTEVRDRVSGVGEVADHIAKPWLFYIDRADGAVGSYGTQGDPGDGDDDTDCDYWKVTFTKQPNRDEASSSPDYYDITLTMNGEPD